MHTSLWVEAKALLDGLEIAKHKSITHVWIEVDSMVLVQMFQGSCSVPWNVQYIFRQIFSLLPAQDFVSRNFREGNRGADYMAN